MAILIQNQNPNVSQCMDSSCFAPCYNFQSVLIRFYNRVFFHAQSTAFYATHILAGYLIFFLDPLLISSVLPFLFRRIT